MANIINAITTGGGGISTTADASGSIQFATNNGTTAMTIDTSQNVGIGTASPTQKLQVAGNISQTGSGYLVQEDGTNTVYWTLNPFTIANSFGVGTAQSIPFIIGNNNTERMRIDSVGNVLVGATSPGSWSGGSAMAATGYVVRSGRTGSFANNVFNINWTGSAQLWIDTTNVGTFAFTSDYRIKKNIETSTTPALERIAQIRPVTYEFADYKELFKADGVAREGFIAHELAEVIPSAVEGEKDAEDQIQSLKLDALCSVMVKAIQEQQTIINELKSRIETLEAK